MFSRFSLFSLFSRFGRFSLFSRGGAQLVFLGVFFFVSAGVQAAPKPAVSGPTDQEITDFSLAGYGDKGKKSWEIAGDSANILESSVKLNNVTGNLYGEKEDVKLTADKGDFDKDKGNVHLQENVVITTSSGAKMTTESLDWDRQKQLVATDDLVNIVKENMVAVATGALGEPSLNQMSLQKDVKVDIDGQPKDGSATGSQMNQITITCDGPLEIDYGANIAVFKNNVRVDTQGNEIYSDLMEIYFSTEKEGAQKQPDAASGQLMGTSIQKIVAKGSVKIIKGENISYSQEAVYTSIDKKIVLSGRPKLVIYSAEDISASLGN